MTETDAPGVATDTGAHPEATVDAVTKISTGEVPVHRLPHSSDSRVCTWLECSHDKRTWAEVQEEEQREKEDGVLRPLQALTPTPEGSAVKWCPKSAVKSRRNNNWSKNQTKYDVCEVFSPPRICPAATLHGLRGGWSIDGRPRVQHRTQV